MTSRPAWNRRSQPERLSSYLQLGVLGRLLRPDLSVRLPGPGASPIVQKAREIFDILSDLNILYSDEPTTSDPDAQIIRSLDQVVYRPRHGTCLDLCVAYSSACLDAGIYNSIVVFDRPDGGASHSVVLIDLDKTWSQGAHIHDHRATDVVHLKTPTTSDGRPFTDEVREISGGAGAFVVVDVSQCASSVGSPGPAGTWDTAVAHGWELANSSTWTWGVGVDVSLARSGGEEEFATPTAPTAGSSGISPAHIPAPKEASPLTVLRARSGSVQFVPRPEQDAVLAWVTQPSSASATRVCLVVGPAGAGKTRLAAQACEELSQKGWFAGFLQRDPAVSQSDLDWLASIVSPTMVAVDYAEEVPVDGIVSLARALASAPSAGCLVLTARAAGDWWVSLCAALARNGHPVESTIIELPATIPWGRSLFDAAVEGFSQLPGMKEPSGQFPPELREWSALDLTVHAWLDVTRGEDSPLPDERSSLFDQMLRREFDYWARVLVGRGLPRYDGRLLAIVGAAVSLVRPTTVQRLERAISFVPEFEGPSPERSVLVGTMLDLLSPNSSEVGFSVRPDAFAEHLVVTQVTHVLDNTASPDAASFLRAIATDDDVFDSPSSDNSEWGLHGTSAAGYELHSACDVITRAAHDDPQRAARAAAMVLTMGGQFAAGVAAHHAEVSGGPFARALEDQGIDPWGEIPEHVPYGHASLRRLALFATRVYQEAKGVEPEEILDHVLAQIDLAIRLFDSGYRYEGLAAVTDVLDDIEEAAPAGRFRTVAARAATVAAALSLSIGETENAAELVERARDLYYPREPDPTLNTPPGFFFDVVAVLQIAQGNAAAAVQSTQHAFTDGLHRLSEGWATLGAGTLQIRAAAQSRLGHHKRALRSAKQSLDIRRRIAQAQPGPYVPDFADSLVTYAIALTKVKSFSQAGLLADEAVTIVDKLWIDQPVAFGADLADALVVGAVTDALNGRITRATDRSMRAQKLFDELAATYPEKFEADAIRSREVVSRIQAGEGVQLKSLLDIPVRLSTSGRFGGAVPLAVGELLRISESADVVWLDDPEPEIVSISPIWRTLPRLPNSADNGVELHESWELEAESIHLVQRSVASGKLDLARQTLQKLIQKSANDLSSASRRLQFHLQLMSIYDQLGSDDPALQSLEAAIGLERSLRGTPESIDPLEAGLWLSDLATRLRRSDRVRESLTIAGEAISSLRQAFESEPEAARRPLAVALNMKSVRLASRDVLSSSDDQQATVDSAVGAAKESVGLIRNMASQGRAELLSSALATLAQCLGLANRHQEARAAFEEAIDLLDSADPGVSDRRREIRSALVLQLILGKDDAAASEAALAAIRDHLSVEDDHFSTEPFGRIFDMFRAAQRRDLADMLAQQAAENASPARSTLLRCDTARRAIRDWAQGVDFTSEGVRLEDPVSIELVSQAATSAELVDKNPGLLGKSRRAVQALYDDVESVWDPAHPLPEWVTTVLDPTWVTELIELSRAENPESKNQWLSSHSVELATRTYLEKVRLVAFTWPEVPFFDYLVGVIEAVRESVGAPPAETLQDAIAADPTDAESLGQYALLLHTEGRDIDGAEDLYLRAIAADQANVGNLANYALFLTGVRRDYSQANLLYKQAILLAPDDAHLLCNFAFFLQTIEQAPEIVAAGFQDALRADPNYVIALGAFATFLDKTMRDSGRAQEMYARAYAVEPADERVIYNYALFLSETGKDPDLLELLISRLQEIRAKTS